MKNEKKNRGGRPLKLGPKEKKIILELAKFGLDDTQVSQALGICEATLSAYKKRDPEFLASLKQNKELGDSLVKKSLFRRAVGYDYKEEFPTKDGAVLCQRVMHPDVTACIFWLKNRQPDEWRDKTENNLTSKGKSIVDFIKLAGEARKLQAAGTNG